MSGKSVLTLGVVLFAIANVSSVECNEPDVKFLLARHVLDEGGFTLSNGIEVFSDDWDSLIMASFGPDRTCTASFVGRNVLLTAAHCIYNSKTHSYFEAALGIDGWPKDISLKCEADAKYIKASDPSSPDDPRSSQDYALCHADIPDEAMDLLDVEAFESIDASQTLAAGSSVVMTGYGCTNVSYDGKWHWDDARGTLAIGNAQLATVPLPALADSYFTVLSHGKDQPALCPGDSGGPLMFGSTAAHPLPHRRVIAVNSSITAKFLGGQYVYISSMAALNTGDFRSFLKTTFAKDYPADKICGIDLPAGSAPCN